MDFTEILRRDLPVGEYLGQYNKKLEEASEIIICGAGGMVHYAFKYLAQLGMTEKVMRGGVTDRALSENNIGQYNGYPVLSLDELRHRSGNAICICTPKKKDVYLSIMSDLMAAGVGEDRILPAVDGSFFIKCREMENRRLGVEDVRNFHERMERAYMLLEDELSRDVFKAIINYKLTANIEYLIPIAQDYGQLSFDDQFFVPEKHTNYLDLGAYDGDTVREYIEKINSNYENIYCFEPDPASYKKLEMWISDSCPEHVKSYPIGAGKEEKTVRFSAYGTEGSNVSDEGDISISVDAVDHVLNGASVNYIKFDIEGAEYDALSGLEKTIEKNRPTMCVSCYHLKTDIFELPLLLQRLCPDYRFYMRHHLLRATSTVIYAVPKEQEIRS